MRGIRLVVLCFFLITGAGMAQAVEYTVRFMGDARLQSAGEPWVIFRNIGIHSTEAGALSLGDSVRVKLVGGAYTTLKGEGLHINRLWIDSPGDVRLYNQRLWVRNELHWLRGNLHHSGDAELRLGFPDHRNFHLSIGQEVWTSAWVSRSIHAGTGSLHFPLGDGFSAPAILSQMDSIWLGGWVSMRYLGADAGAFVSGAIVALDSGRFVIPSTASGTWQLRFRKSEVPVLGGKLGMQFLGRWVTSPDPWDANYIIERQIDNDALRGHPELYTFAHQQFIGTALEVEEDADFSIGVGLRDVALALTYSEPRLKCVSAGMWLEWPLNAANEYNVHFSRDGQKWEQAIGQEYQQALHTFMLSEFYGGYLRLYERNTLEEGRWNFVGQFTVSCGMNSDLNDWYIQRIETGWNLHGPLRNGDRVHLTDISGRSLFSERYTGGGGSMHIPFSGARGLYIIYLSSGALNWNVKTVW